MWRVRAKVRGWGIIASLKRGRFTNGRGHVAVAHATGSQSRDASSPPCLLSVTRSLKRRA